MVKKNKLVDTRKLAVDIDFLNIPTPEDFLDLEELQQPLVKIETFLGVPVVLSNPETKISSLNGRNSGDKLSNYYILTVQSIETGETWRSSCSHWFMQAYIDKCKELGHDPFPVAVKFYQDGQAIKFTGARQKVTDDTAF